MSLRPSQFLEVSTSRELPLGQYEETPDGLYGFRYGQAGEALSAGHLVTAAANVANHLNLTAADTPIGAAEITVTLGATEATQDQYQGGLLVVNAGTGIGQQFAILGNTKGDASATIKVKIAGALAVALDTDDSKVTLYPNKFAGVTTETTAALRRVGVAIRAMADDEYGWFQVKGPAGVLIEGTAVAVADPVIPSTNTAGAVEGVGSVAATDQIVGFALQAGADGEVRGVDLTLG
jgi:hypothetical protein